jgi:hypothetical protein
MRSSYLKNPAEVSEEDIGVYQQLKSLSQKMTGIMKQMHSVHLFRPTLKGCKVTYAGTTLTSSRFQKSDFNATPIDEITNAAASPFTLN